MKGKIYKIEPKRKHGKGECYIGSTVLDLKDRMDHHKVAFNSWRRGKARKVTVYDLFQKYGIDNCKIKQLNSVGTSKNGRKLKLLENKYLKSKCINIKRNVTK